MFTFGYKSKFNSIVRALAAIGIGIVLMFGGDAMVTVVKIIACFLSAAGVVTIIHAIVKSKEDGTMPLMLVNAALDILIGLLLFYKPEVISGFIINILGVLLIIFGILQFFVVWGTLSLLGAGFTSLILSILAVIGGAFLVFNPFTQGIMGIAAGAFMVIYGVSELFSIWKVKKAQQEYEIKFAAKDPSAEKSSRIDTTNLDDVKEADFRKADNQ